MSHDLCLFSPVDEFLLVCNPDADDLGRDMVSCGNAAPIVEWYERHCRNLGWNALDWEGRANLEHSWLPENDCYAPPPEWADPDPVARHIAMVNAFLAFAPGATKTHGFRGKKGDRWWTKNSTYGVRYQCSACGKITLGMHGTDDPRMHWPTCPRRSQSQGAVVNNTDPCTCGHAPEEHGRNPAHPTSTGCTECDCIAYEPDPEP